MVQIGSNDMTPMSHKLDPILDAGLHPEASFSKSRSGEKWGYIDVFKHELGLSKCIFETDEEGSFLQLTMLHDEVEEEHVPQLLEVLNLMNGIQDQLRLYYNPINETINAKREFDLEGRKAKQIQEMVFERYERMKDIFDDVLWAHQWKVNTDGDFQDLFEHLAKRNEKRGSRRERNKGKDDFDPAYA